MPVVPGPRRSRTRAQPPARATAGLSAAALLRLMWLASPALPVGGFSYSEALESAVEAGLVTTEPQASRWLQDQLALSLARSELPALAKAFGAWQRGDLPSVAELNTWVLSTRESSEQRQQTEQMGRSLLAWLNNGHAAGAGAADEPEPATAPGLPASEAALAGPATLDVVHARLAALQSLDPAPTWPVAFALAGLHTGAPLREVMLSFAFGWAENMVQAALKAVPLGQSAGQRILAALADTIPAAVDHARALSDSERMAFAPMLAILSSQHETQYSRLFRS